MNGDLCPNQLHHHLSSNRRRTKASSVVNEGAEKGRQETPSGGELACAVRYRARGRGWLGPRMVQSSVIT